MTDKGLPVFSFTGRDNVGISTKESAKAYSLKSRRKYWNLDGRETSWSRESTLHVSGLTNSHLEGILRDNSSTIILFDSQTVFSALQTVKLECQKRLKQLVEHHSITLNWMPTHSESSKQPFTGQE